MLGFLKKVGGFKIEQLRDFPKKQQCFRFKLWRVWVPNFCETRGIYVVTICICFLNVWCKVQITYRIYVDLQVTFSPMIYSSLLPDTPLHHIYRRNVLGVIAAICWTSTKVWAMVNDDLRPPVVEILEKAFIQVGREICRSESTWTTRMSMMSKKCCSWYKKPS